MGLVTRLLEGRSSSLATPEKWLVEWFSGRETASGVNVTASTALEFPPFWAAVRVIAETIGSLPLILYRRLTPRGKERAVDSPLYGLLHSRPNPEIGSMRFRELLSSHAAVWGNGYAEIQRDKAMRPIALWPLLPDRTWAERVDGIKRYRTVVDGRQIILAPHQVFHLAGLGFDGLRGYSVVSLHRQSIGLGLAAEEFAGRFFKNDAALGVVLKHPKTLSDPAYKRLEASWRAESGLSTAHRTKILEEGLQAERLSIPLRDAQFIEGRRFNVGDIARIFRVPLALLEEHEKAATYASVEQFMLSFVVHTIRPWLVRWEEALNQQLIPEADREEIFAEHLIEGLLRGDTLSRYQAYAIGRQWGWFSADDVLDLENRNPLPNGQGESYMVPLNMIPASDLADGGLARRPMVSDVAASRSLPAQELRDGRNRRRLAKSFEPVVADAALRILKRETKEVMRLAKKHLSSRAVPAFLDAVDRFYLDRPAWIRQLMAGPLTVYSDAVEGDASREVGRDPGTTDSLEAVRSSYLDGFLQRHIESSLGQVKDVVRTSTEDGADPIAALQTRFAEWDEKRPAKVAGRETIQMGAAIAKAVFVAAGFTRLVWRSAGGRCPYCTRLDGKTVEIHRFFVDEGDDVWPREEEGPMEIRRPVGHPPLHAGCDCMISPG